MVVQDLPLIAGNALRDRTKKKVSDLLFGKAK